jgi:hypothetical protein
MYSGRNMALINVYVNTSILIFHLAGGLDLWIRVDRLFAAFYVLL